MRRTLYLALRLLARPFGDHTQIREADPAVGDAALAYMQLAERHPVMARLLLSLKPLARVEELLEKLESLGNRRSRPRAAEQA